MPEIALIASFELPCEPKHWVQLAFDFPEEPTPEQASPRVMRFPVTRAREASLVIATIMRQKGARETGGLCQASVRIARS